jgi:Lar family restriction alleviation protein
MIEVPMTPKPEEIIQEDRDAAALEPCPFCGGPAERLTIEEEGDNFGGDVISCTRCGASSHVEFGRKENLVSIWNTRSTAPLVELMEALEIVRRRLETIAAFGDPFEISQEPEEYGGTDDGLETVCMAYENMQSTTAAALNELNAALAKVRRP